MRDVSYKELARAKVQPMRNIVLSECSRGGYTLGMQLEVKEGDRKTAVFLKGAFQINDLSGLVELRDALNVAISSIESGETNAEDAIEWDDV